MYTDDELANMRFEISRPLEVILRQIDPYHTEKDQLWDAYEALDTQRSKLSHVVWNMPHAGTWASAYTVAYNEVDEAAQYLSFAQGAQDDDDRRGHLTTTEQHLHRAVESLTMV